MKILAINWLSATELVIFGFTMVFIILILLVGIISIYGKIGSSKVSVPKVQKTENKGISIPLEKKEFIDNDLSADVSAAIAMALHLYFADVHDEESHIMTIKTVERRYSPWSSKIYGLNNLVR